MIAAATALVVDDDPLTVQLVESVARAVGLDPVCAGGGVEARRILEAGLRPAVMVTDRHMPDLDGLALAAFVRERRDTSGTRIVVFSSSTQPFGVTAADVWIRKGDIGSLVRVLEMTKRWHGALQRAPVGTRGA